MKSNTTEVNEKTDRLCKFDVQVIVVKKKCAVPGETEMYKQTRICIAQCLLSENRNALVPKLNCHSFHFYRRAKVRVWQNLATCPQFASCKTISLLSSAASLPACFSPDCRPERRFGTSHLSTAHSWVRITGLTEN